MENNKNPDQEMQQGFVLTMLLIFSLNRTVHLFSRVPGSCGCWHFGWLLLTGWAMQLFYYQVNVESTSQFDAIRDHWVLAASVIWLMVHKVCRSRNEAKGYRTHSYSSGVGILYRCFPNWRAAPIAIASDIATAATLCLICHISGSPILGGWYFAMTFWCLLGEGLLAARDRIQMQQLDDARIESEIWSQKINDAENWQQMQKERWGDRYE